jgi:hypothetical protein
LSARQRTIDHGSRAGCDPAASAAKPSTDFEAPRSQLQARTPDLNGEIRITGAKQGSPIITPPAQAIRYIINSDRVFGTRSGRSRREVRA